MIAETRDPIILNYFAAHPDIAPDIGGAVDFTAAIRETARFFVGEHGALCFEWCAPGTYEVHIMLTRQGRGRWGLEAVRQSLRLLDADHVWARIKEPHVAIFARWCGFAEQASQTLYAPEPSVWRIFDWRNECLLQS